MLTTPFRPARLVAGAGCAVLLSMSLATVAAAQDSEPVASAFLDSRDIAIGVDESTEGKTVALDIVENLPPVSRPDDLTVEIDSSPADGILVVEVLGGDCSVADMVTTCDVSYDPQPFNVMRDVLAVNLKVASDAEIGDVGVIEVTTTGDGFAPSTTEHEIEITEPTADLQVKRLVSPRTEPGGVAEFQPIVHNAGDQTAEFVRLEIGDARYADVVHDYSNCFSTIEFPVACTFELDLAPGETAMVPSASAVEVGVPSNAPHQGHVRMLYEAWPVSSEQPGSGDGPVLQLVKVSDVEFGAGRESGTLEIPLGDNPSDVAAIGADITGAVGDVVSVEVGASNDGPADLQRGADRLPNIEVIFPEGVTVLSLGSDEGAGDDGPRLCAPIIDGAPATGDDRQPHGLHYLCEVGLLPASEDATFTFDVEITSDDPAAGRVEVNGVVNDPNPDSQVAEITLHQVDPDDPNGVGDDPNGVGTPQLPVTGTTAAVVAAAGALVLALGLTLVVAARKRRIRLIDEPGT